LTFAGILEFPKKKFRVMIDAATLKAKRTAAGIAGSVLCKRLGIARSRLSDIERGYVTASADELARMEAALDELLQAKAVIQATAAALGWPSGGIR
jgi:transcriptional regulator with XRE-family HTH domain